MFVGKVICDHCNRPNMASAMECEHCGKALHETVTVSDSFREELRLRVAEIQAKNPATIKLTIVDDEPENPVSLASTMRRDVLLVEQESGKHYHISHDCAGMIDVGRFPDSESDLQINLSQISGRSGGVSRFHASFQWHNNSLYVIDHNSKNGTYVNNHRLEPEQFTELADHDIVSFGYVSCVVYFQ